MNFLDDPAFWALVAGFALLLLGGSPLTGSAIAGTVAPQSADRGCLMMLVGTAVICLVTAVKVLG